MENVKCRNFDFTPQLHFFNQINYKSCMCEEVKHLLKMAVCLLLYRQSPVLTNPPTSSQHFLSLKLSIASFTFSGCYWSFWRFSCIACSILLSSRSTKPGWVNQRTWPNLHWLFWVGEWSRAIMCINRNNCRINVLR